MTLAMPSIPCVRQLLYTGEIASILTVDLYCMRRKKCTPDDDYSKMGAAVNEFPSTVSTLYKSISGVRWMLLPITGAWMEPAP